MFRRVRWAREGGLVAVLAIALGATTVQAQAAKTAKTAAPSLTGSWRAGATAMDVAVESWGSDCGPTPQSSRSEGGGVVTITQTDKQLVIRSRNTEVRSDACWSQNPAMRRISSSVVDQVWITRCKTPPNDPREEEGTYTLKVLGPDTLLYRDVSRYNWALKNSKCVATFTTSQTLVRSSPAGKEVAEAAKPQPVKTTVAPAPKAVDDAPKQTCTPGAPAQITLRPKRATIQVGERVCFRARVSDASDCEVPSAPVAWSLEHSKALRGELHGGCFTAAATSAEAEGDFTVVASSLGQRAEAAVQVKSMDLSGLIAQRIEGGGLDGFDDAEVTPAATPTTAARISTRTVASEKSSLGMWLGIGAVLVVAAGAAALVLRRPRPGAAHAAESSPPPRPSRLESSRATTPEAQPAVVMPKPSFTTTPETPAASEPWICPLCRLGYPVQQATCTRDGSPLMPYSEFTKRSAESSQAKQKRCPKCGASCPATAVFCGSDGTRLVDT